MFANPVLPKLLPFNFGDEAANLGESTTVQCSLALGDLPVNFSWFLNNENVNEKYGINIGMFGKKISVLSIESLDGQHAGNYTCIAQNAAGSSSHSSELKVMGIVCIMYNFILSAHLYEFSFSYLNSNSENYTVFLR